MHPWLETLPKIPRNEPKLYIPTPEVMTAFINAFDQTVRWGLRDYVVSAFGLGNGLRIGELCHLRPEHLNLDAGVVTISPEGKTGERIVFPSANVVSLLKRWKREREHFAKCEYFFLNRFGGKCTPNTFDQAFADHRQRTGLGITPEGNLTPHTLRHYFCTMYLVNGGSLHNLKLITGHKSYDTLQIYVHLAQQMSQVREEQQRVCPFSSLPQSMSSLGKRMRLAMSCVR
jgi:integrase/recombinase XerD